MSCPGGMRYHLLSPEDREELGENSRPRRKKHDFRIALFGGSQPQSCRYFNPKVTHIPALSFTFMCVVATLMYVVATFIDLGATFIH